MFRLLVVATVYAVLAVSCVDNELSFFIEHVKTQPAAPECGSSAGDPWTSGGLLDLAFRNPYTAVYLVTSTLIPREQTNNFVVESNGITIEGMEVYVRRLDGALVGVTEYYEFENFIPPESSDIAVGVAIPASVVAELSAQYACAPLSLGSAAYPPQGFAEGYPTWVRDNLATVYTEVRFLGHTAGGTDVQTQVFTFPIQLCCACLVNWNSCFDPCARYCQEPEDHGMCTAGVANGGDLYDCRAIYYNPNGATWYDPAGECQDGTTCDCDDCSNV